MKLDQLRNLLREFIEEELFERRKKKKKKKKKRKKKRGLWANIHARRKAGKRPKRPGEEGYPETLDIDENLKGETDEFI